MSQLYKNRLLLEKYPLPKEHVFIDLIQDLEVRCDFEEYPYSIFFFKNNEYCFEILKSEEKDFGYFYCSHKHYWSIFEKEYNMNYNEVQDFTNDMFKEHFKINFLMSMKGYEKRAEEVGNKLIEIRFSNLFSKYAFNEKLGKYFSIKNVLSTIGFSDYKKIFSNSDIFRHS